MLKFYEIINCQKNKSEIIKSTRIAFCDFTRKLLPCNQFGIYSILCTGKIVHLQAVLVHLKTDQHVTSLGRILVDGGAAGGNGGSTRSGCVTWGADRCGRGTGH